MTHSYRIHFFHFIWSTKDRYPWISSEIQPRLYAYIGAIIKKHSGKLISIGGMKDHVHLLLELPNLDKFSHILRDVKSFSSLWIHKHFVNMQDFAWQEGYVVFRELFSIRKCARIYSKSRKTSC